MFKFFLVALALLAPGCHSLTLRRAAQEGGKSELCMLAPTYESDFVFMAARLKLQSKFQRGAVPTTVVVFDTPTDQQNFCSWYSDVCNDAFFPLTLSTMIGDDKYNNVKVFAKVHTNRSKGCGLVGAPMGRGQIYQTLKKFYGAIHGPEHCKSYWVSDSESLPFRPYDFNKVFQPMAHSHLITSWYPNAEECTYRQNDWNDPACSQNVAGLLGLDRSWNTNGAFSSGVLDPQYHEQTGAVDQFWTFDRDLTKKMIDHVEQDTGSDFATKFTEWGWSDSAFYHVMAMYYAGFQGHTQTVKNFPDEIKRKFPEAHASCCSCGASREANNQQPGCVRTTDLFSTCMMNKLTPKQISTFMVEDLGLFAHWFEWGDIPSEVLNAHQGFSWCVNNCFHQGFLDKLASLEGVNTEELLKDPVVKEAFARNKHNR